MELRNTSSAQRISRDPHPDAPSRIYNQSEIIWPYSYSVPLWRRRAAETAQSPADRCDLILDAYVRPGCTSVRVGAADY